jgi:hypothetical protein
MTDRAPTDLEAMIATLRKGGVFHAEFHDDGSVKVLTMGPDMAPTQTEGDDADDPAPSRASALREHARRLQFGPPTKPEAPG